MAIVHSVDLSTGEERDVEVPDDPLPDAAPERREARLRLAAALDRLRERSLTDPVVADLLCVLSSGQET